MKSLILSLLFVLSQLCFAGTPEQLEVFLVRGKPLYDGKPIAKGDKISTGSILDTTAKKAAAVIKYPNGRAFNFQKGRVKLENKEKDQSSIELLSGAIYGWFRKEMKSERKSDFQIKTKTAVAGVRGTKFMIEEWKKGTYFCVCEGELSVSDKGKTVALKKGYDMLGFSEKPMSEPVYAKKAMLDRVADAVSAMGGTTERYWESKSEYPDK